MSDYTVSSHSKINTYTQTTQETFPNLGLNIFGHFSFSDLDFFVTFLVLILAGCVLTYSQFLCAAVCSALTASLVGVAKAVLQTFIGFFVFGGVKFHPLNIFGNFK